MASNKPAAVMRVVSFYHKVSGLFHPRHLMSSDAKSIALNTPPDHIAIGRRPLLISLETGLLTSRSPSPRFLRGNSQRA